MRAAKSGREDMRRDHGHQRIGPGNPRPSGNQREHVWIASDDTLPAADKKRPAAPEYHRCRQRELDPGKHAMRQALTESPPSVPQHGDQYERTRKKTGETAPPPHVELFPRRDNGKSVEQGTRVPGREAL